MNFLHTKNILLAPGASGDRTPDLLPASRAQYELCYQASRRNRCEMASTFGSKDICASQSFNVFFFVCHYYCVQFATDRLWVETVVIIRPIFSAYRLISLMHVLASSEWKIPERRCCTLGLVKLSSVNSESSSESFSTERKIKSYRDTIFVSTLLNVYWAYPLG